MREAWGLIPDEKADTDNAVWDEIKQVFEPVKDKTWPTGRQNNRT